MEKSFNFETNLEQVDELYAWQYIIERSQGKAYVTMISGEMFKDAAESIEKLTFKVAKLQSLLSKAVDSCESAIAGKIDWQEQCAEIIREFNEYYEL